MSHHGGLIVALLCIIGQVMSNDTMITSKSFFHKLFIITGQKFILLLITSFTLSITDSLMNNLFMIQL